MITDALLTFVPINTPLSLVAGAGVNIPSPSTIDLSGAGLGVTPPLIWGNTSLFGQADAMGVGERPELAVSIGILPATSNAATLNCALQGAADNGSNQPSIWYTFGESGPQTVANLTANSLFCRLPWLPPFPFNLRPRFLRLLFQVPSATNFTAGTISSALVVPPGGRDDTSARFQPRNYVVN